MNGVTEVCGLRVAGRLSPVGRTAPTVADLVMEAGPGSGEGDELDRIEPSDRAFTVCEIREVVFVRFQGVA